MNQRLIRLRENNRGKCLETALSQFRSIRNTIWNVAERKGLHPADKLHYRELWFCCGRFSKVRKPDTTPYHFWVEYGGKVLTSLAKDNETLEERPVSLEGQTKTMYLSTMFAPGSIVRLDVNQFADAVEAAPPVANGNTFYEACRGVSA